MHRSIHRPGWAAGCSRCGTRRSRRQRLREQATLELADDGLEMKTNVKFWYNIHLEMPNGPSQSISEYLSSTSYFLSQGWAAQVAQ